MPLRSKKDLDPATRKLEKEGLLHFNGRKKRGSTLRKIKEFGKITYDFWSGVKYIVVLSALLWWIPLFGPILAGYVGGRRTGGPKKGLFASIVALGIIGSAYYLLTQGYVYTGIESIIEYPDKLIGMAMAHSFLGPYLRFVEQYWTVFFHRLWAGVPFGSNSYILTVIFAYIGGIISYEKRKELTEGVRSLDRVKENLSSIHRYAKNPMNERASVSSAARESLEEMSPVRYSGRKKTRQKESTSGKKGRNVKAVSRKREMSGKKNNDIKRVTQDKNSKVNDNVRHHSSSNGDDWEFL